MSSVPYPGNGTSTDDSSHTLVTLTSSSSSTSILPHPYLNSPSNVNYPPVPSSTYPQYYPHPLPQQPLLHMPQSSGFYPATNLSHLAPPADFSNSSSSVASSSSSLDSARKATNRKRTMEKTLLATKTAGKRKASNQDDDDVDDEDDDDEENKCYLRPTPMTGNPPAGEEDKEKQARENHCEIERRRRVKMATYFAELCDMVPSCANLARKPDKLTILRMAAQFMKNLRTTNNSLIISPTGQADLHKPSFLNDQELKYLMVESCDAFLFALNCENLRVIYVSDAIQYVLSYNCQDWYSRFFYDLIHPDDVEKVREQFNLQSTDGSPTGNGGVGRILDLKTGTVKKDGHASGARLGSSKRSFICRLRVGPINPSHPTNYLNPSLLRRRHRTALGPSIDGQLYEVVHINGYIRNLSNSHPLDMHPPSSSSSNNHGQMAFVAIARVQTSAASNVNDLTNGSLSTINSFSTEFTCRCHWETSEILFVDQRCTPIIGYKSQDLLHKILFDQIHPDDQLKFQDLYKRTVTQKNSANPSTNLAHIIIRFRTNLENDYVSLKCSTYAFCNPCTDEIEFLIVTFLSLQPVTSNKTSVIANANDYTRHAYDSFTRTTYSNADGQDYSNGNGGRTYNVASSWSTTNENWNGTGGSVAPATGGSTSSVDYSDAQNNLNIYHSYHS